MPKTKTKKNTKGKVIKKVKKEISKPKEIKEITRYFEGLGRRKTSTARVRLFLQREEEGKIFLVNQKTLEQYFPTFELQETVLSPLKKMNCFAQFRVSVKVKGGGLNSQTEAIRHGIAKALIIFNPDFRKRLKKAGFLTRDPRMRERKKFGLKRARRAPQWQKR